MRKLIFSFVFSLSASSLFSQIISGVSTPLTFQVGGDKPKISRVSKMLSYNAAAVNPKLSNVSNTLYFGVPKPSAANAILAKREPAVSQEVKVVQKPISVSSENLANNPVATPVIEPKPVLPANKITPNRFKELGEEYAVEPPKYRALILAVSDYQFAGPDLPSLANPTADATALFNVLTQKYLFDSASINYIKNPTRQQIIDTFEQLASEVTEKENLLVFYAGHGSYDSDKQLGYWLPSDAKITSKSNWIPNSTIKDYLTSIKSKHTLLITDACFGGSIFKTRAIDANTILRVNELFKDPSRKAITSGNLTQVPDKSPFIEFLLKKLNENEEDYLPTQKLFSTILEPIINTSSIATPQFGVIQGAGDQGGDFIFIKRK